MRLGKFVLAVGVCGLVFSAGCKGAQTRPELVPAVSAQELSIVEQGLTDFRLRLDGEVHSELPARLERATYEFVVEGKVVGHGDQVMAADIPAGGSAPFKVEENSRYVTSAEELEAYSQKGGSILVALRGQLFVRQGDRVIPVDFARSRQLRVPRLPSVKIHSVDGARYSAEEVNVQLSLGVVNPNPFPLPMEGASYKLSLAGKQVGEGKVGAGERVGAGSTGVFEIQVAFNKDTYGPDVVKVIKSQHVPYEVKGELKGPLYDLPYELPGTLKLNVSR